MKTQKQIADLEARIDFEAVSGALLEQLKRGELGQRKTVNTLLDRIGDTLVELRRHRVPLRRIVTELKAHGLEISEGRLRVYLRSRGVHPGKSTKPRKKLKSASTHFAPAQSETGNHHATGNAPTLPLKL